MSWAPVIAMQVGLVFPRASYSLSLRERAGVRAPRFGFRRLLLGPPTLTLTLSRQRARESSADLLKFSLARG
jgi:hypothetical protein